MTVKPDAEEIPLTSRCFDSLRVGPWNLHCKVVEAKLMTRSLSLYSLGKYRCLRLGMKTFRTELDFRC